MSRMFRNFVNMQELWTAICLAYPWFPVWWRGVPMPAVRLKTVLLNRPKP